LSATDAGWEHFETEADVGVHAWAATRAEAFAQASLGVFALIVRPEEVTEREHREVRAQADSPERLLVGWINECLYVHEIEGFVVRRWKSTRAPRSSFTACSTARRSTPAATSSGRSSRRRHCTGCS